MNGDGTVISGVTRGYPVFYPQSGWSEQNPEDWYGAVEDGLGALLNGHDAKSVRGVAVCGQMHGLVALDSSGKPVRPAILWNDGRTQKQTEYLNRVIGKARLLRYTANIAFAGFTAPKILWLQENEPDNFGKTAKIMLPKDYIVYRLCGELCTDYSDASGTLLLDVRNRRWSREMCGICSVGDGLLPRLCESYGPAGTLRPALARRFGMPPDTAVAAGAGDNAAAAVGTGTVADGACNISLGTSGTVFIAGDAFCADKSGALHSFCHADGAYHLLGCVLSAASCNKWWQEEILQTGDFAAEQADAERYIGKNGVFFLPYLMGERSPHNDVRARGAFVGMRPDTTRKQMTLAVLEGVAYALKDCVEAARKNGAAVSSARLCGGGAASGVWRRVIAGVLGLSVELPRAEGGPAYGAAILAAVAAKEYASVREACGKLVKPGQTLRPDPQDAEGYARKYEIFKTLYPALKDAYKNF
jgi:xylulokinase